MKHNKTDIKRFAFFKRHAGLRYLLHALIVTFLLETLNRHSLFGAFRFVRNAPVTFICNVFIVFATLCISNIFRKRKRFVEILITILWLFFGVVNAIVLRYRMTPFSAEDFMMVPSLLRIADNYLTVPALIAIGAGIILLVGLIVILFLRIPKESVRQKWKLVAGKILLVFVCTGAVLFAGFRTGAISTDFMNLADAYEQYGFAYCFTVSLVDVGINKPTGYSKKRVKRAADKLRSRLYGGDTGTVLVEGEEGLLPEDYEEKPAVKPNLIMLQLESFFDPYNLAGFSYSEDPIPCFRELEAQYASGFITVPVVGAGTSNTEFEILTGMSTDYFGAGEYPYNTVLKTRTVEAIPYLLKDNGYISTVLHNNTGTFYNRDLVFANMGFDRFIPEEYMYDLDRTPNNWARDSVLPEVILDCLHDSDQKDFIYTITVQSHGRYPEDQVLAEEDKVIKVTNTGGSAPTEAVEYYVNQIHEVDEMIADLIEGLSEIDEPVLLVLFGDHLPALGFEKEEILQPSLYQTEYVIWDNYEAGIPDGDIQSESISTLLLDEMQIQTGIIPAFHRAYDGTKKYSDTLKLFEYDMLYGEGYLFEELSEYAGASFKKAPDAEEAAADETEAILEDTVEEAQTEGEPDIYYEYAGYQPADLEIGYKEIKIAFWFMGESGLFVSGYNFNEFSKVILNDKVMDTLYINSYLLYVRDVKDSEKIESVAVGQFDENLKQLGEAVVFEKKDSVNDSETEQTVGISP